MHHVEQLREPGKPGTLGQSHSEVIPQVDNLSEVLYTYVRRSSFISSFCCGTTAMEKEVHGAANVTKMLFINLRSDSHWLDGKYMYPAWSGKR
jgi:hypothetical protein